MHISLPTDYVLSYLFTIRAAEMAEPAETI